jgi:hypothetical protein
MRRKPHSNRFKRLRRQVNELVAKVIPSLHGQFSRHAVRYAIYETIGVRSRRYTTTTKNKDGTETVHQNMATQVRMQAGSPRLIYQKAKYNVQDNRRT